MLAGIMRLYELCCPPFPSHFLQFWTVVMPDPSVLALKIVLSCSSAIPRFASPATQPRPFPYRRPLPPPIRNRVLLSLPSLPIKASQLDHAPQTQSALCPENADKNR
jgi:hypothetical protein